MARNQRTLFVLITGTIATFHSYTMWVAFA